MKMKIIRYTLILIFFALTPKQTFAALNRNQIAAATSGFENAFPGVHVTVDWNSPYMNAEPFFSIKYSTYVIHVSGSLVFSKLMTQDLLDLILCHELGHVRGGKPKFLHSDLSVEGQADYYATSVCLKHLWVSQDNHVRPASLLDPLLPQRLIDACKDTYESENDIGICVRSNRAAYAFVRLFYPDDSVSFLSPTPDKKKATMLQFGYHPGPQCRLDTFLSGSLEAGRPACWFAH